MSDLRTEHFLREAEARLEARQPGGARPSRVAVPLAALEEAAMRFRAKVGVVVAENAYRYGEALSDVPHDAPGQVYAALR
mmetsp:Transcript_103088/g.288832  ORF Transcript_103088/g.288832 Transcript_103088/m.288832 type:complete len:80 (-) Transcript_103088:38-277(-)